MKLSIINLNPPLPVRRSAGTFGPFDATNEWWLATTAVLDGNGYIRAVAGDTGWFFELTGAILETEKSLRFYADLVRTPSTLAKYGYRWNPVP